MWDGWAGISEGNLSEELIDKVCSCDFEVSSDIGENARECSHLQGIVPWDSHVMLAAMRRCQSHMAARLAGDYVPERRQQLCEVVTGDVAWQFHAAITSSRT